MGRTNTAPSRRTPTISFNSHTASAAMVSLSELMSRSLVIGCCLLLVSAMPEPVPEADPHSVYHRPYYPHRPIVYHKPVVVKKPVVIHKPVVVHKPISYHRPVSYGYARKW